jgi:integrase/recombinase XerD
MAARNPLPKRRPHSKPRVVQAPAPGKPLHGWLAAWSEYRLVTGASAPAQRNRHMALQRFTARLDERAITEPAQITRPVIERYQRHLCSRASPTASRCRYRLSWRPCTP